MIKLVSKIKSWFTPKPLTTDQELVVEFIEAVNNFNKVRKKLASHGLKGHVRPTKRGDNYIWIDTYTDYSFDISIYRSDVKRYL